MKEKIKFKTILAGDHLSHYDLLKRGYRLLNHANRSELIYIQVRTGRISQADYAVYLSPEFTGTGSLTHCVKRTEATLDYRGPRLTKESLKKTEAKKKIRFNLSQEQAKALKLREENMQRTKAAGAPAGDKTSPPITKRQRRASLKRAKKTHEAALRKPFRGGAVRSR